MKSFMLPLLLEKSDIVSAIDGTPQIADVEAQVGGLTKVPEFAQILGSIVLDCGLHQLPRSATTQPLHWAVRHQNNAILQVHLSYLTTYLLN
jgi:hypothetical protein